MTPIAAVLFLGCALGYPSGPSQNDLDYRPFLLGDNPIRAMVRVVVSPAERQVTVVGEDYRCPTTPFDFDWGDGQSTSGFFPMPHVYPPTGKSFLVRMTSHYPDGSSFESRRLVSMVPPGPCRPNPKFPFSAPNRLPDFNTVLYPVSASWTPVGGSFDAGASRETIQNLLSVAASVESGYFEGDHEGFVDGRFPQVLMTDTKLAGGGYSVWYTRPVAFVLGTRTSMANSWSSAFHEIGHNVQCNAPKACRPGGRLDGNGNIMMAEATARILQQATGKHLVRYAERYGIDPILRDQIASSCESSMLVLVAGARQYVDGGCRFETWNKPETPEDETYPTFVYLAYRFMVAIEQNHRDWDVATQRFMRVMRCIDEDLIKRLDNRKPTQEAGVANSTLMVAAASYGVDADLRSEFRKVSFPVDDGLYRLLMDKAAVLEVAAK